MARTLSFPFIDHVPPLHAPPGIDAFSAKIYVLIDDYALALGDVDKATNPEDACYHEGRLDALEQTLVLLLDVPLEVWDAHHGG